MTIRKRLRGESINRPIRYDPASGKSVNVVDNIEGVSLYDRTIFVVELEKLYPNVQAASDDLHIHASRIMNNLDWMALQPENLTFRRLGVPE